MTEYDKWLDKMYFEIGATLMDNDICRKGMPSIRKISEEEILRSSRRTFMNLKVMMMRLERALYGEKDYEEDETEISHRDTSASHDTEVGRETVHSSRVGDFPC
jgi:hypothetical protein